MRTQILSLITLILLLFSFTGCKSEKKYWQEVEKDFAAKIELVGNQFYTPPTDISPQEEQALHFLYAYMPVGDIIDHNTAYHIENIRYALKAKEQMPWGKDIPDLYFRHFVLPVRVNNENLDDFRKTYYQQLKERVEGMNMVDAILEINHWCHERVTYQPTDGRTSSPMATIVSAFGRCGEESTLLVAALRTIGIPARQVYTPRWAHTDDNHAWVEAWADGAWHFLGACEPEPVLDLGWFNSAASRAMLMHTRVFGRYNGPEEKMNQTATYTEINLIDNYAPTSAIDFEIKDEEGEVVPNARVDFMIYNYGQFCPVVKKYADNNGKLSLTAGRGDMIVWATNGKEYGYKKVSFGKDSAVTIVINSDTKSGVENIDIVPPTEKYNLPKVTASQREKNDRRKIYEDSLRNAYTATFFNLESATKYTKEHNLTPEIIPYLIKSAGNKDVIAKFALKKDAIKLLQTLTDKDLRDIPEYILTDNYLDSDGKIIAPRVENEPLNFYKHFFAEYIAKDIAERWRENPIEFVQACQNGLTLIDDEKTGRLPISSVGVWKSGITDVRSRKIFFVNVARTIDLESRVNSVTGALQYKKEGKWIDVDFEKSEEIVSPKGCLKLNYTPSADLETPQYFSHFTISKIENGVAKTLEFSEEPLSKTEWEATFGSGIDLDEGRYFIVTGRRLASGAVLSAIEFFDIVQGQTTSIQLPMRKVDNQIAVIGSFDAESKYISLPEKSIKSVLETTGRGYFVVGVIGVGQEPTNHTLADIVKVADKLQKWGRTILILFPNEQQAANFNQTDFGEFPSNVVFGIDNQGTIQKSLVENMHLTDGSQLPIFILGDSFNRVVFCSQGYTIGLGDRLCQIINGL